MFIVVMGVAGSGKTTIGRRLAAELGWPFYEGDDFHPPANIAKMAAGLPLSDDDRAGWLAALAAVMAGEPNGVMACSALKEKYRAVLQPAGVVVQFVYLQGEYELILTRLATRTGHYMKPAMLQSQYEALEEPAEAWVWPITRPAEAIVAEIAGRLVSSNRQWRLGRPRSDH